MTVERWLEGKPIGESQQPEIGADWELPPQPEVEFESPKLERKKMTFNDSKKDPKSSFNDAFCYPNKSIQSYSSRDSSKKDNSVHDYRSRDISNRHTTKEYSSKCRFSNSSSHAPFSPRNTIREKDFAQELNEEYFESNLDYLKVSANEEGYIEYFLCDRAPLLPNLFYILPCDDTVLMDIEQFGNLPGQMAEYFRRRSPPHNWYTVAKSLLLGTYLAVDLKDEVCCV